MGKILEIVTLDTVQMLSQNCTYMLFVSTNLRCGYRADSCHCIPQKEKIYILQDVGGEAGDRRTDPLNPLVLSKSSSRNCRLEIRYF